MRTVVLTSALFLLVPPVAPATASAPAAADEVTASANMKTTSRLAWRGGTDLEFAKIGGRRYVVAGAQNNYNPTDSAGLRVVDVTNPAKPVIAGFLPCNASQNDVQVKGRYAFLAVDFNARGDVNDRSDCFTQLDVPPDEGVVIVDLANPRKPRAVGYVKLPEGAHNTTVHPTKPLLYVSDSETATNALVHIVDWTNPRKPSIAKTVELSPGDAVHDITFNAKGDRAYVAGAFTHTLIVNTADPLNPTTLGRIYDPAINFHHQADPTPDGRFLLITDELVGAEGNAYCPGGGIHVWDISRENAPVKVGAYYIPDTFAAPTEKGPRPIVGDVTLFRCTAHVMRIAPDGKTLVMAWYSQGIQVLDLSGLPGVSVGANGQDAGTGMKRLGHWKVAGGDAWSAKMDDRGYIFTGDTQRGMDVVKYSKPASPVSPGLWLTPEQALLRATRDKARQPARTYFCYERLTRLGQ